MASYGRGVIILESCSRHGPRRRIAALAVTAIVMALTVVVRAGPAHATSTLAYVANLFGPSISVVDTGTNTVVQTITDSRITRPNTVAINPAGTIAYIPNGAFGPSTVAVLDLATNTITSTIAVGANPVAVAFIPSGATAYVTNFNANTVSVIDTATAAVIATVPVGSAPRRAAVNPAGTQVWVPNSGSGTISVIDVATDTVTTTVSLGGSSVSDPSEVAFNPSGSTAYVSDLAGKLDVVDTATQTETTTVSTGSGSFGLVLNPAATTAYVANGFANTVTVVNLATNTVTATIPDGSGPRDVGITPTGRTLYVVDIAGNDVSVIDTGTNTVTGTVPVGGSPFGIGMLTRFTVPVVSSVSPASGPEAGGVLVTINGSGFTLASSVLFGGVPAASFTVKGDTSIVAVVPAHTAAVVDVTVTAPAGTSATSIADQYTYRVEHAFVYVANQNANTVTAVDAVTNAVAATIPVGPAPFEVAANPAGTRVYSANVGGSTLSVIDTATDTVVNTITVGAGPAAVAFTPSGAAAYVSDNHSNTVSVIDTATETVVATIPVGSDARDIAITPDGATAYVVDHGIGQGGSVFVISTASNIVTGTITTGSASVGIAITPDGRTAYVCNNGSASVSVIDTATNTVTGTIPVGDHPSAMAITPGGATVYAVNNGGQSVSAISTATNTVTATIPVGAGPLNMAVNSSGTTGYVTNSGSGTVSVIDLATNTVTATIPGFTFPRGITTADVVQPVVASVSPTHGPEAGGTTVTITGSGFSGASAVRFDGTAAPSFTVNSDTSITATAPAHADGAVDITVVKAAGTSATGPGDRYTYDEPAPAVTSVSPSSGPETGGTSVTITGTDFLGASGVSFGSSAATSFTVVNDTTITATAPPATAIGTVDVTVTTSAGTSATSSADQYTYVFPFGGFLAPVAGPPTVNMVHAGQSIPIQFQLGGNQGLNVLAAGFPQAQQVTCPSGAPVNTGTETMTAGGSGLQFDPSTNTYTYVWKTPRAAAGTCVVFILGLNDGTFHTANFQLA